MSESLTYPHDYRALFAAAERPIIVGGQAVNLWAITYLETDELTPTRRFGSHDLDVLSSAAVLKLLRNLPDWRFTPTPWKVFGQGITGRATHVEPGGRRLLVEVLHSVAGLEAADLKHVEELQHQDTTFRVLDPIAMLKAKAYNVRRLKQDGDPPRHDAEHLQLVARCLPPFLTEDHASALAAKSRGDAAGFKQLADAAAKNVSRTFAILTHRPTVAALRACDIDPRALVPGEFQHSSIQKIARAYSYQLPRVDAALKSLRQGPKLQPAAFER